MTIRDRLRSRQRPTTTYPMRVADTQDAERELLEAQAAYRRASRLGGPDSPEARDAKTRVEQAEEALRGCYVDIKLVALPPDELEALIAQHPPREGVDDGPVNADSYPRALFLACVDAEGMTREDWEYVLDHTCSYGERQELYLLAQALNTRGPSTALPKGWMPTRR